MKTGKAGIGLIKSFEGLHLEAYLCPANVWTIGYGHTGVEVKRGLRIDEATAELWLRKDLERFERAVERAVTVPINQNEFDALVSLAFNIGVSEFEKSTARRLINQGDRAGAADAFLLFKKAGGKVLPGLIRRRQAERVLFLKPAEAFES